MDLKKKKKTINSKADAPLAQKLNAMGNFKFDCNPLKYYRDRIVAINSPNAMKFFRFGSLKIQTSVAYIPSF